MKYIIFQLILPIFFTAMIIACNDNLIINQRYEFTVTHLPVPKRLKVGEIAEIRFQINRTGKYENASYFIRYFQYDGKGTLATANGTVFIPNDSYELPDDNFRLYYTSFSEEQHTFEVVIFDNFGQECLVEFSFNNDNREEEPPLITG